MLHLNSDRIQFGHQRYRDRFFNIMALVGAQSVRLWVREYEGESPLWVARQRVRESRLREGERKS